MIGGENRRRRAGAIGSVSRLGVLVVLFLIAVPFRAGAQSQPTADLQRLLQQIKVADTDQLAVSEEDGRFLRVMIATSGAKRVLEVGGAYGYSAVWMGLGLRHTGGRLTTIEYDATRAKMSPAPSPRRARHRASAGGPDGTKGPSAPARVARTAWHSKTWAGTR